VEAVLQLPSSDTSSLSEPADASASIAVFRHRFTASLREARLGDSDTT